MLIINNDIRTVQELEYELVKQEYVKKNKVVKYSREDKEGDCINKVMEPGNVIFATNLAGRGTDIKCTPNVYSNGGIHVIVTYLPDNIRVQEQAFGRTGRNGQKGT